MALWNGYWWCLGGGVVRTGSMPNSQGPTPTLFIIFFFCSHIGVQVSPIPGLEVVGTWFGVRELIAGEGWFGPLGLVYFLGTTLVLP